MLYFTHHLQAKGRYVQETEISLHMHVGPVGTNLLVGI